MIMSSTNPMGVAHTFRDYARKIHRKAVVADPNYLAICVMCGKIETWVERHYPSFVTFTKESKTIEYNTADPRALIVRRQNELEREKVRREKGEAAVNAIPEAHVGNVVPWQLYAFIIGATIALFAVTGMIVLFALWFFYGEEWNIDIGSLVPRVDL